MDGIKIHCVNRGLNMMDLLHIKTKLKTKTTTIANHTEPFLLIDVRNQES